MNDFYEYVMSSGEDVHKGAPYAFFLKNQKKYLTAVEEKKREKRRLAKVGFQKLVFYRKLQFYGIKFETV